MTRKTIMLALTLLAFLGAAPVLTACNTIGGAGEDISSAGDAVTGAAN